jgi:hypothetical protein
MEHMLAKMDSFQEDINGDQTEIKTNQVEMLAQMEPKMDANLKEFIVEIKAWKKR